MLNKPEEILHVLDDPAEMEKVITYLEDKDLVAYDTETTGLDMDCEVVGLSVCADEREAFYCIMAKWSPETKELIRNPAAAEVCKRIVQKLTEKRLIMHNAIFDCRVTYDTFRIQLIDYVFSDTMIAAHILDEGGPLGLKPLGSLYFDKEGGDAQAEAREMKASVVANGGIWQEKQRDAIKEMYKADPFILGKYGAKDTLLTLKLFFAQCEELFGQGLDKFFFEEESMPLLRLVTYDLNTNGLKIDILKMRQYEKEMEHEVGRLKGELDFDLSGYTKERPEFKLTSQHLAWLLFVRLGNKFRSLTKGGKKLAKEIMPKGRIPYSDSEKKLFMSTVNQCRRDAMERLKRTEEMLAPKIEEIKADIKLVQKEKNGKGADPLLKAELEAFIEELKEKLDRTVAPVKFLRSQVGKLYPEKYIQVDKATLKDLAGKYEWVKKLLKMKSEEKLLTTYVRGILSRVRYGVVYPAFKQTGTDSGRYSSSNPNFQNLPRDDKRIKSCVVARPGMVFVGADYSQLEPRVFASISQDPRLLECFRNGEDFYSVVGIGIFGRHECSAYKKDKNAFAEMYPEERQIAKAVCLAAAYGTTASKLAQTLRHADGTNFSKEECQDIIDRYFKQFPGVRKMMLAAHETAKRDGIVYSLFGRPRRIPEAVRVAKLYPGMKHEDLDYEQRSPLNLAMNSPVQMTAGNIINRASIAFKLEVRLRALADPRWARVHISSQIHDELHAESPKEIATEVQNLMKYCMEETVELPGVALVAEPKIAEVMSELK